MCTVCSNKNNLNFVSIFKNILRVETYIQYNKNNLKFVSIYKNPYQYKIFKTSCFFGLDVDSTIDAFIPSFLHPSLLYSFRKRTHLGGGECHSLDYSLLFGGAGIFVKLYWGSLWGWLISVSSLEAVLSAELEGNCNRGALRFWEIWAIHFYWCLFFLFWKYINFNK